jgi:iron complex outermembrane receptor protein
MSIKLKSNARTFACVLAISALIMGGRPASAQDAAAKSAEAQGGLEEIVVTAQRREQSAKDVPISLQVIGADSLSRNVVVDTRDLAAITPTVNYQNGASVVNSSFSLRGVSSAATASGFQPSTGLVIDGVSIYSQGEFISRLGDVERIEVLNGPQGTLFGKNSTAGVINIVTKQPSNKFEAEVESFVTNDHETYTRGMINVPLTDVVRIRVNTFYQDQQPLFTNLSGEPAPLGQRAYGVNAKLAVDFSSAITFTLDGTFAHTNSSANQDAPIGAPVIGALQQAITGIGYGRGITTVNQNTPAQDIFESKRLSGTLIWKASDSLSLTSITSTSGYHDDFDLDIDLTPAGGSVGRGETLPNSAYPIQYFSTFGTVGHLPTTTEYWSEEARANYDSGPFNTVVGVYYQNARIHTSVNQPLGLDGAFVGATPGQLYITDSEVTQAKISDKTAAVFGDITYALTSQFKAFGGVRFTHETYDLNYARVDYFTTRNNYNPITGLFSVPPADSFNTAANRSVNNVSGRLGLQFQPNRDTDIYVSAARGYKGPSGNTAASLPAGRSPIVNPEIATAFELGAKLRLLDNRLALNGAVFWEKISDIQATLFDPANTSSFSFVLQNAGALKTRGFEGDALFSLTQDLRLSAALAYVKATYEGFAVDCNPSQLASGTCPNQPIVGAQDGTGHPAIGSPKWKYSLGPDYLTRFGQRGLAFFANASWTWTDKVQYTLNADPATVEPSHGMLNAAIGVKSADDKWELQLFGKNLTNDFYYSWLVTAQPLGAPLGFLARDEKRYGGIRVIARF